jgi:hypothetical protein
MPHTTATAAEEGSTAVPGAPESGLTPVAVGVAGPVVSLQRWHGPRHRTATDVQPSPRHLRRRHPDRGP